MIEQALTSGVKPEKKEPAKKPVRAVSEVGEKLRVFSNGNVKNSVLKGSILGSSLMV